MLPHLWLRIGIWFCSKMFVLISPPVQGRTRLIIRGPFKSTFFKNLFNAYLVGGGEKPVFTFAFRKLCKKSRVGTRVNWRHISDLFQWCVSAPHRSESRAAAPPLYPAVTLNVRPSHLCHFKITNYEAPSYHFSPHKFILKALQCLWNCKILKTEISLTSEVNMATQTVTRKCIFLKEKI
jgi:hypothetical protein